MDNTEDKLSYKVLLKERGVNAAINAVIAITAWMLVNNYVLLTPLQGRGRYLYVVGFFVFAVYFTWKPRWAANLRKDCE